MGNQSKNGAERVILSWSGGKDSALALEALRGDGYDVVSLLCTVAGQFQRVSHHGVRVELLEAQAEAVGVPLHRVDLPAEHNQPCTNDQYEAAMEAALGPYLEKGIRTVAFGDLMLQDIRAYREDRLGRIGMAGLFPLWGLPTGSLARRFVADGYRAYLSCVTREGLGEAFAGAALDEAFLDRLPAGCDPCGENGEYHSFVWDGPIFSHPVPVRVGQKVNRDVRCFADLLLDKKPSANHPSPAGRRLDGWPEGRLNKG